MTSTTPAPTTDDTPATHDTPAPGSARDDAAPAPRTPAGPAPRPARSAVEGLLLGLAAGDAAGWPAARHRAARMPEWTRRLTRELDTFAEQNATTTLPVPIALNQPPSPCVSAPPTTPSGPRSPPRRCCSRATTPCSAT